MTIAYPPTSSVPQTMHPRENQKLLNLLIVDDDRPVREACREAAMYLGYSAKSTDPSVQALWLKPSLR